MNELNVGSLEACQRLYRAGIVLETDFYWTWGGAQDCWYLIRKDEPRRFAVIPAPSMAEVWRELPTDIRKRGERWDLGVDKTGDGRTVIGYSLHTQPMIEFNNDNPTDALIEMLIWVEKEKANER